MLSNICEINKYEEGREGGKKEVRESTGKRREGEGAEKGQKEGGKEEWKEGEHGREEK